MPAEDSPLSEGILLCTWRAVGFTTKKLTGDRNSPEDLETQKGPLNAKTEGEKERPLAL